MAVLTTGFSIEITVKDAQVILDGGGAVPAGSEVAITSLPGEQHEPRLKAAEIVKRVGLIPVPHLAARRIGSAEELDHLVGNFVETAGVDRFFLIAGDVKEPVGPFSDAVAIINSGVLARHGVRRVGVTGYPEGHPGIPDDRLWQAMLTKRDALKQLGLPYEIVTQFGFDSEVILDWLKRLRDAGVAAPVKIGVPGPASIKSLLRFAAVCGVNASSKVIAKYGISLASLLGHSGPDLLVGALEDKYRPSLHGDMSLHFYPFGGIGKTTEWIRTFRQKRDSLNFRHPQGA